MVTSQYFITNLGLMQQNGINIQPMWSALFSLLADWITAVLLSWLLLCYGNCIQWAFSCSFCEAAEHLLSTTLIRYLFLLNDSCDHEHRENGIYMLVIQTMMALNPLPPHTQISPATYFMCKVSLAITLHMTVCYQYNVSKIQNIFSFKIYSKINVLSPY